MEKETEFKYKSVHDSHTVLKYLEELVAGIESGKIDFVNDGEKISLSPRGMLSVEIKASNKDGKGKISLKMSWKERSARNLVQPPLIIEASE